MVCATLGNSHNNVRYGRASVLADNNPGNAAAFAYPYDRTQVMRVFDSVENEYNRAVFRSVFDYVLLVAVRKIAQKRDKPLMCCGKLIEYGLVRKRKT